MFGIVVLNILVTIVCVALIAMRFHRNKEIEDLKRQLHQLEAENNKLYHGLRKRGY